MKFKLSQMWEPWLDISISGSGGYSYILGINGDRGRLQVDHNVAWGHILRREIDFFHFDVEDKNLF